ncbi:MAG TPA: Hsp70 family protein [Anaeromyxobacter sp.]
MAARWLVGIDLGTVNTALAAVDLAAPGDLADAVAARPIPQLVGPGEIADRPLLPSSAYLPGPELPAGAARLPWEAGEPAAVVGAWAREQGARVPGRLVTSAKSWLAHPRVDRTAAILPWGAPEGVRRLSPVDASALYLGHLRAAWDHRHPDAPLARQEIVLTVPASFDEAARELTLRAAERAGLGRPRLLEEPQAAFHDWAARHRGDLENALGGARLVLVVDVGGGTTDLTLIGARLRADGPELIRVAVGDHLLLGGDNVDLALARRAEERMRARGVDRLDPARFAMLVHACRLAKERVLAPGGPERAPVAVAGCGSRLVETAASTELGRDEVRALVLEGFLPRIPARERPRRAPRTAGLAELGLPYEPDPAITRHVAAFLAAHASEARGARGGAEGLPRPDAILFNGGFFTPSEVRERLREVVSSWFPEAPPIAALDAPALEVAVARGAAYHALVRRGLGLRIGGGSARAYYVGIDAPGGRQALCVVPRHLDEGARVAVPRTFALALGRPVRFEPYASAGARTEAPGDVAPVTDDLAPLPPVETVLQPPASGGAAPRSPATSEIPVRLEAVLTEIGTLELWCVAADGGARWRLEFQLRGRGGADERRSEVAALPRRFDEARALVDLFYGKKAPAERRDVKGLFRALEKLLGPREGWPTPVVRELWGALHAGRARRRRSADHERLWVQLTGYCLRPGFGAPLDAWRAAETFQAYREGLQHQGDPHAWQAWWVLWRRIAGGLEAAAQQRIFETVAPFLPPPDPRRPVRVPGVKPEAVDEMIRLAGALERLDPSEKVEAGEWILARAEKDGPAPHLLWALGRIGARVPFHASGHLCVPARTAEEWIARVLAMGAAAASDRAFALAQLARRSGDRARDVDDAVRAEVLRALAAAGGSGATIRSVREVAAAGTEEESRIFGESLPAGLRLIEAEDAGEGPPGAAPAAPG